MKLSGAIFDVDDTLTVSEWVWKGIPEKFLERHGKSADELEPVISDIANRMEL